MAEPKSFTYELLEELGENHKLGCKCCRFNKGVDLPIPKKLTAAETSNCARELAVSVFKSYTNLNSIVKRFEPTIQKRWMRKNHKQRRDILLTAWPNMSLTHRPDFENFRRSNKRSIPRSRTCDSEAFLWPYVNLEDLQQQQLLLLFLNSRGRNLPDTFRLADVRAAHLGEGWFEHIDFADKAAWSKKGSKYLFKAEDGAHCMLFEAGKNSPTAYGSVIDRTSPPLLESQLKYVSRWQAGLLALEIQERIYRFLLDCAKLILHDVHPRMFFLAPHQPEPVMPNGLKPGQWLSLSHHALEAPYRVPSALNLDSMKGLCSARREVAEDHVWMLREDPSYFLEHLREWNEHIHPKAKATICACTSCSSRVAGRMIVAAFVSFISWQDIHCKLESMSPIEVQIKRADKTKLRLKQSDEERWFALWEVLNDLLQHALKALRHGVPNSPRLRRLFRWSENEGSEGTGEWIMLPGASEAEHRVEQLTWSITHPSAVKLHGLHGLVQEIQYMLDTDVEASQYMDSWIIGQFFDIALVSELLQSIDRLAPWFDVRKARKRLPFHIDTEDSESRELSLQLTTLIPLVCEEAGLPWPTKMSQFDYPVDKRRNKVNVEQMIKAERHLDRFWNCLECELFMLSGIDLAEVLGDRLLTSRVLHRTQAWKEPIQLPTPQVAPQKPLAELDTNVRSSRTPEVAKSRDATPSKQKVKTRGKPAAPEPRHMIPATDTPAPLREKVKICKRAFNVFQALLPSADDVVQQRCELAWEALLYAMDTVGLVPEKLYGSVWIFKPLPKAEQGPDKVKVDRSIQFHEPKEVRHGAKIARAMVRTFGRRLKHRFGWNAATEIFECV